MSTIRVKILDNVNAFYKIMTFMTFHPLKQIKCNKIMKLMSKTIDQNSSILKDMKFKKCGKHSHDKE